MNINYVPFAVEVLKAMYEHNSKVRQSIGDLEVGAEPLTVEQVANDLRVIYNEITKN